MGQGSAVHPMANAAAILLSQGAVGASTQPKLFTGVSSFVNNISALEKGSFIPAGEERIPFAVLCPGASPMPHFAFISPSLPPWGHPAQVGLAPSHPASQGADNQDSIPHSPTSIYFFNSFTNHNWLI